MSTAVSRADALRAAARALVPQLQAATATTDRERQVPAALVAALRRAGVYRILVPHELGGDQVDLQTYVDVVETVSEGNGAAGWDLATSSWHTRNALALPREGARRIYADGPDVIIAGGFAGGGHASATDGGYRVSGHWRFGSGCAEAQWMAAGCRLQPNPAHDGSANARADFFIAMVPRDAATIEDTWQVAGMRGTGSHDWSLTEVFVPSLLVERMTAPSPWPGALYRLSSGVLAALQFSAVASGIARRAITSLVDLAKSKVPGGAQSVLRERVQVQEAVARAEFLLESGRAYRAQIVADVWATAEAGEPLRVQQQARLRLAGTNATENAVHAVDLMFQAGGTTAIEDASPLSHCFRDVHVVASNANVQSTFYAAVGRVLLDMEPGRPLA